MKNNSHITVVLDRSGSMERIRSDIIGGFNMFLEAQQKDGEATLTLVQFDTEDSYEVIHSFKPIRDVPRLTASMFEPRGGTPLLDAMGRTITNLDAWLSGLPEDGRPGRIVVVFVTDGQENSSSEHRLADITRMITERREQSGWQFVFLSSDLDAINEAAHFGMPHLASMSFDKTSGGTQAMFASLSDNLMRYRKSESDAIAFSAEDRSRQESESKRGSKEIH